MILTVEDLVMTQLNSRIESGQRSISSDCRDLGPLISKLQSKHAADIERMIRLHRLRETQRIKEHLEQKLTHLQDRIEVLNELEGSPKQQKANLLSKEVRHQYFEQEEVRRKENSEFAKKLAEEQRERVRRHRQEARQQLKEAQLEEEKDSEQARKLKEENLQHMKEQEKAKFEQLAQKRKEYMQSLAKLPVKKTAEMQRNASMPELERKKQEIAAKRKLESWSEVHQHMQAYDEEKKKREDRGALEGLLASTSPATQPKFATSKFLESVKEEDLKRREEEEREREERAKRIEMKKRYGEIIKEMYAPAVDPDLQQEIQQRVTKIHTKPRVVHSQAASTRTLPANSSVERLSPVSEHRPKVKRPKLEDKPQPIQKRDYLKEARKGRTEVDVALLEKLQRSPKKEFQLSGETSEVLGKVSRAEAAFTRKEGIIKRLEVTNSQALAARQELDSELLAAVKTKFALIKSP